MLAQLLEAAGFAVCLPPGFRIQGLGESGQQLVQRVTLLIQCRLVLAQLRHLRRCRFDLAAQIVSQELLLPFDPVFAPAQWQALVERVEVEFLGCQRFVCADQKVQLFLEFLGQRLLQLQAPPRFPGFDWCPVQRIGRTFLGRLQEVRHGQTVVVFQDTRQKTGKAISGQVLNSDKRAVAFTFERRSRVCPEPLAMLVRPAQQRCLILE
ncbi:hypothetical protein D3C77_304940 [compost metagenome]